MSRSLKSWADDGKPRRGPRFTFFRDLATMWRPGVRRPTGVPPKEEQAPRRLSWQQLGAINFAQMFATQIDLSTVGRDALVGLERPFIFAVNEAGPLDHRLLSIALPRRLRPRSRSLSRALSQGRNVVVFSQEPVGGRVVGEFDTTAAELARQHSVAIVPVGIIGSFRLADTLKLPLNRKPKVSVSFGSPIHIGARSLDDTTREVQARVEHLVGEGELSWWEVEQRRLGGPDVEHTSMPRWRRLWEQAAVRPKPSRRRIWR